MDVPAPTDDVDLTLRHVTRLFPEQLARALLPPEATVSVTGWLDTQVTSRQRRLDRALSVTVNSETRLLHNEWELIMRADVPFRVFEYHALLALTVAGEAPPGTRPPPIESTVVLFSGREAPWPTEGEYRTSPRTRLSAGCAFESRPSTSARSTSCLRGRACSGQSSRLWRATRRRSGWRRSLTGSGQRRPLASSRSWRQLLW